MQRDLRVDSVCVCVFVFGECVCVYIWQKYAIKFYSTSICDSVLFLDFKIFGAWALKQHHIDAVCQENTSLPAHIEVSSAQ